MLDICASYAKITNHNPAFRIREQAMIYAKDLMITELFTLNENDTLALARSLMGLARIRHIPIVRGDMQFVGLVTHRDILEATVSRFADIDAATQADIDKGIPIAAIMQKGVKTITPETPVIEAAKMLYANKYGCLPVLEGEKLVGIITEADFLRLTITLLDPMD